MDDDMEDYTPPRSRHALNMYVYSIRALSRHARLDYGHQYSGRWFSELIPDDPLSPLLRPARDVFYWMGLP